jgi:hypothetical protein
LKMLFFCGRGKPATCRFQLRSISGRIPSRSAIALTDSFPSFTSLTASNLNSRVNRRRVPPMNTSFPNSIVRAYLGVHEIGVGASVSLWLSAVDLFTRSTEFSTETQREASFQSADCDRLLCAIRFLVK